MLVAAVGAVALLAIVVAFQLALALGAPLGRAAWGGTHPGVLTRNLRIASAVVAVTLYPVCIVSVLDAAGIVGDFLPWNDRVMMWVLAAFFGGGTLANLASRSRIERGWAPVAAGIAVSCAVIARAL